jgi:hypothetical protein
MYVCAVCVVCGWSRFKRLYIWPVFDHFGCTLCQIIEFRLCVRASVDVGVGCRGICGLTSVYSCSLYVWLACLLLCGDCMQGVTPLHNARLTWVQLRISVCSYKQTSGGWLRLCSCSSCVCVRWLSCVCLLFVGNIKGPASVVLSGRRWQWRPSKTLLLIVVQQQYQGRCLRQTGLMRADSSSSSSSKWIELQRCSIVVVCICECLLV